jgi:hypothetical protein
MTVTATATRPGVEAVELGSWEAVEAIEAENAGHAVISRIAVTARCETALLRAVTGRRVVRPVSGYTPREADSQNERWAQHVQR